MKIVCKVPRNVYGTDTAKHTTFHQKPDIFTRKELGILEPNNRLG